MAATKCWQQFGSCWILLGKHEHMEPKHESEHHTSKTAIFPGFCDFFWRERFSKVSGSETRSCLGQDEPESDGGHQAGTSSSPTIVSGVSTRWKKLRELSSLLLLVFW